MAAPFDPSSPGSSRRRAGRGACCERRRRHRRPAARWGGNPNSRVSRAGVRARGRAFRAGAVCAPDCPSPRVRASSRTHFARWPNRGFFAPARAAKRSGPADAASFLPSQYGLRPVEVKYIFRYNSKLLDKSVFTSLGQPGGKAGIRHPKAQAYRLFSISGPHRTRPSRVRGNIVCELPKAIPEGRNTLDLVARLKVIHKMKTNALSRYAFCSIGVQRPHNWHPQIFSCAPLTSGCEVAESGVK